MRRMVAIAAVALAVLVMMGSGGELPRSAQEAVARVERLFSEGNSWTGDTPEHAHGYTFSHTNPDGTPARFDPCQEITYAVNAVRGGPGALDDVHAAIAQISFVSGLRFRFAGETGHVPTAADAGHSPTGAQVVIAWAGPEETDLYRLAGVAVADGVGGPDIVEEGGIKRLVSGSVVLEPDSERDPGFGAGSRGVLLLHELGHLVGLGHTDDGTQVMADVSNAAPRLGSGDVAGLVAVGGRCG